MARCIIFLHLQFVAALPMTKTTYRCFTTKQIGQKLSSRVIPAFSSTDRTAASQIIHKDYTPLSFYYGLPDYLPCTNYAQVEADLSAYHLSSINQGFFPSTIMNFNSGVPTEDERAGGTVGISKFGGANNAGKILMTFNDSQDTAPTIESFNLTDAHQVFDYLNEQCSKGIKRSSRCRPCCLVCVIRAVDLETTQTK